MGYTPHVLVVGGGAVGTGIARDLAIRGLDVTLVERRTLGSGTTGRMDALLTSGAQLAETDPRMATHCFEERRILGEIASHCIEETEGLLVQYEDDEAAFERLRAACEECGIPATPLSGEQAREREAVLADSVERALLVPDAAIDPFRLAVATARDALAYGADIRPHTAVTDIHVEKGAITGVDVRYDPTPGSRHDDARSAVERGDEDSGDENEGDENEGDEDEGDEDDGDEADDSTNADDDSEDSNSDAPVPRKRPAPLPGKTTRGQIPGEKTDRVSAARDLEVSEESIDVDYIVNATGAAVGQVASMADLSVPLEHSYDGLVVGDGRQVETAVTVRPPGEQTTATDWDSLVPFGPNCVFGTVDSADDSSAETVSPAAVDALCDSLAAVVPAVADCRRLRTFRRVRYRLSTHDRPAEHGHEFVLVDHAKHHDCWGMTTVLGGSVTTHRLAAEHAADEVCGKFGITRECQTADLPLPGSDGDSFTREVDPTTAFGCSESTFEHSKRRLGSRTGTVLSTEGVNPVVCECQSVTRAEVQDALEDETGTDVDLSEVQRRTTAAMGECQGGRCAHRLAAELHPRHGPGVAAIAGLNLLEERWRGQYPRDTQLTQLYRTYRRYGSTMNFKFEPTDDSDREAFEFDGFDLEEFDLESFDEGPEHRPGDRGEWDQQTGDEWGLRTGDGTDRPHYCPRPGGEL